MPGSMFAAGDSVALHTVEEEDLGFVEAARNDPAVRRPLTLDRPSNGEQTRAFFEDVVSDDDGVHLLVCVDGDSPGDGSPASEGDGESAPDVDPVGMVSLFNEDDTAGVATVSYWVTPGEQGNGYATEGVGLLCGYAFADRRLNKLRAEVLATNDGSRRVLENLGFAREGVLREEKFLGGDHVDVHRFGLLADEWEGV